MSKFHNDKTAASDPGRVRISEAALRRLEPGLFGIRSYFFRGLPWQNQRLNAKQTRRMIAEHVQIGDSRAAVVMQVSPQLLVAAYTDEQDAVLILRFPQYLVAKHNLNVGTRLLTVNTYGKGGKMAADITEGPASYHRYTNYYPIIAEFVSDDTDRIENRKKQITESEWRRAADLGKSAVALPNFRPRDGRPLLSGIKP